MRKNSYIIPLSLICGLGLITDARAQMTDTLGALAIDGMLTNQAAQGVGQMRSALNKVQFQQDLAELNLKVQTTFLNNYSGLSKEYLDFNGFSGVDWQIKGVSPHEYYVEFRGIDDAMCLYLRMNNEAKRVEINGAKDCGNNNNNIRLYY